MTNLVEMIAKALVEEPDKVVVTRLEGTDTIQLQVASGDMGKVIGKQGRIAKALRTVVKAAGAKDNQSLNVEIVSDEELKELEGAEDTVETIETEETEETEEEAMA